MASSSQVAPLLPSSSVKICGANGTSRVTNYLRMDDGCQIAYQVLLPGSDAASSIAGAAPLPLLMIMGLSGVKEDWRGLDAYLAAERPVVILDNRGIGESDVPKDSWSMERMADDAFAVANHVFAGSRYMVMGISMGGMISQALLLKHPDFVERLILGCTRGAYGSMGDPEFLNAFPKLAALPKEQKRDGVRLLLSFNYTDQWIIANPILFEKLVDESVTRKRSARGIGNQAAACAQWYIMDDDKTAIDARKQELKIASATCPVLLIHGTADRVLPSSNSELLIGSLAHPFLALIPDIGHIFWNMDNGRSAHLISSFAAEGKHKLLTKGSFTMPAPTRPATTASAPPAPLPTLPTTTPSVGAPRSKL